MPTPKKHPLDLISDEEETYESLKAYDESPFSPSRGDDEDYPFDNYDVEAE